MARYGALRAGVAALDGDADGYNNGGREYERCLADEDAKGDSRVLRCQCCGGGGGGAWNSIHSIHADDDYVIDAHSSTSPRGAVI